MSNKLKLDAAITTGDIEIGAVELKNAVDDTRAKIGTVSGLATTDAGLAVTDPVTNAVLGATSAAAVITDTTGTISGKLRGLVKWAFERMPAALGQTTASASLPVVVASDQTAVATKKTAATSTLTNVNDQATNVTLVALNAARLGVTIVNDSSSVLYVKFGATATTTSYTVKLQAGETLIEDRYTGIIDGIWSADSTGAARVTELTL